ncbi:MAG: hypothetical protein HY275_16625 [Gemmatimonadetes bacterium]|nr:hypothetical protein [Gemmatimonadota bacterium]
MRLRSVRSLLLALTLAGASAAVGHAQQGAAPAKLVITPATRTLTAGDTLRLRAEARDADGNVVRARIRFAQAGGRFEGVVDTSGLVTAGSTGTLEIVVSAIVPEARPVIERVSIKVVAGPAARVEIDAPHAPMVVGQRIRLAARAFSALNDVRDERPRFVSSAPRVAEVGADGFLVAKAAGTATLTATAGSASATRQVTVLAGPIASVELTPNTTDARTGDVIRFKAVAKGPSGQALAGVAPTWSVSPGNAMIDADGAFVGYDAGEYTVIANFGARTAEARVALTARDVRRPLRVVGRLPRTRFTTEEVWIHPDGKHAYLGSGSGGDVLYAMDISNPSKPVVTDSLIENTRRVNDVMTTKDGKWMVFTREGAADRKNGFVIASLEDPAHPKKVTDYTQGMTGGVHSAFIYEQPKYGRHVYATNDGTGALHIVDINDPAHPKEVAVWKTARADAGRTLHDIDVQDGLLYGSWWNDGLVILDVGNGIKGGSPSNPQLVSQYKYDLNALYRQVELAGGPGFIRGTHTAWRHKNYVFIADEVFPSSGVAGAKDASAGRAYGRLQVLDVSDITKPKSVAWYEPEFGGVHNVWVAGDTLYMGAYNAGFRVFDISGELRGDLRAQQREIGHLNTADLDGFVKNAAMTWGVVVRDGLAYVNDMYNGLWVVKIEPKPAVVP